MRVALVVAIALAAVGSLAQAISGTFSAEFTDFNDFGVPTVRLKLDLACTLVCPQSSPNLHYAVKGGGSAHFLADPKQAVGSVSSGFVGGVDPSGKSSYDSEAFPPGANFSLTAEAVTCYCGNAVGQGGYIDLTTEDVSTPPWIQPPADRIAAGEPTFIIISSAPRGSETLDVEVTGPGVDISKSYSATEAGGSGKGPGSVLIEVTATGPGPLKVTAVVTPNGLKATKTFDVVTP